MARSSLNYDLLTTIFRNLLPTDPTPLPRGEVVLGRKQLRDLALVCRSFRDPALDCLWACLESLMPLVKVLPGLKVVNNAFYFDGTILDDSPFRHFALRVRILDMRTLASQQSTARISPHLYVLIARELGGQPLLPNLRKIYFGAPDDPTHEFATLPLLFSSGVQEVHFHGETLSSPLFANYCLPLASRQLTSIRALSLKSKRNVSSAVLDAVLQMRNLQVLDLQLPTINLKPNELEKLGKGLKNVTALTLDLHFPSHPASPSSSPQATEPGVFTKLTSFHAVSRNENRICCIPSSLLDKMTSLTVVLSRSINASNYFEPLAKTLAGIQTLRKLELVDEELKFSVYASAITPLLTLQSGKLLVDFKLDANAIGVDGSQFASWILSIYPDPASTLRTLHLPGRNDMSTPVTMGSLSKFASSKGIALEFLSVALRSSPDYNSHWSSTTFPQLISKWRAMPPSSSKLRYLAIRDTKSTGEFNAQQYNDIAQLLDLMFPSLISVTPYSEADTDRKSVV